MKINAITLCISLVSAAKGATRRQTGPVDPGITTDCDFYDTAYTSSDNCAYFENYWGISHADFVAWNPAVKADCSGMVVGHSYCVEIKAKSTSTTSSDASGAAGPAKPSPTQDGLTGSCTTFYMAVKGDTCNKIVQHTKPAGIESQPNGITHI